MKILVYAKGYFGLGYRQTEGLSKTYGAAIQVIPDYTAMYKRINKLDIKQKPNKSQHRADGGSKLTNREDDCTQIAKKKRI